MFSEFSECFLNKNICIRYKTNKQTKRWMYRRNCFSHSWGKVFFLQQFPWYFPAFHWPSLSVHPLQFFFLNLSPLRKILLIWLVYNYLTISANCSWKDFSVCNFCHSLDCFGKWHFSYVDSKSVSFSASLFFVTNSTWPSSNLLSSIEAECKAKLNKKNHCRVMKIHCIFWFQCQLLCVCNHSKLLAN